MIVLRSDIDVLAFVDALNETVLKRETADDVLDFVFETKKATGSFGSIVSPFDGLDLSLSTRSTAGALASLKEIVDYAKDSNDKAVIVSILRFLDDKNLKFDQDLETSTDKFVHIQDALLILRAYLNFAIAKVDSQAIALYRFEVEFGLMSSEYVSNLDAPIVMTPLHLITANEYMLAIVDAAMELLHSCNEKIVSKAINLLDDFVENITPESDSNERSTNGFNLLMRGGTWLWEHNYFDLAYMCFIACVHNVDVSGIKKEKKLEAINLAGLCLLRMNRLNEASRLYCTYLYGQKGYATGNPPRAKSIKAALSNVHSSFSMVLEAISEQIDNRLIIESNGKLLRQAFIEAAIYECSASLELSESSNHFFELARLQFVLSKQKRCSQDAKVRRQAREDLRDSLNNFNKHAEMLEEPIGNKKLTDLPIPMIKYLKQSLEVFVDTVSNTLALKPKVLPCASASDVVASLQHMRELMATVEDPSIVTSLMHYTVLTNLLEMDSSDETFEQAIISCCRLFGIVDMIRALLKREYSAVGRDLIDEYAEFLTELPLFADEFDNSSMSLQAPEDEHLYYYTSMKGAFRLLDKIPEGEKVRLSFMSSKLMNDPYEGRIIVDYLFAESNRKKIFNMSALQFRDTMIDESYTFLKSFTASYDTLNMWSLYGSDENECAGCCIEIDPLTFALANQSHARSEAACDEIGLSCREDLPDLDDYSLYEVLYVSHDDMQIENGLMSKLFDDMRNVIFELEEQASKISEKSQKILLNSIQQCLVQIAHLVKDSSYAQEKERRIILFRYPDRRSLQSIVRLSRSDDEQACKLCLQPDLDIYIDGITLGPKACNADAVAADLKYLLDFMKTQVYPKIKLEPYVKRSAIAYR